jgi:glutamate-1-semialdehyde 2,1-aminomutase
MDEKEYRKRTRKSAALFEKSQRYFVDGINHRIRSFSPYPFFVRKARGPYIYDEDGNRYIDLWCGHYANILGHTPPAVMRAVSDALKNGWHWGIPSRTQVRLAELVGKILPSAEKMRFCSTGTEATMYAVRIARSYTGRNTIFKMAGGWHGANDDLSFAIHKPFASETAGLIPESPRYVQSLPFNNTEESVEKIEKCSDGACVIIEPVIGAGGAIPASREYLLALKEACEKKDMLLIFDEVITGFRVSLAGAQGYYGISPDLTVLGKVLGGGFPIGAVCGREEVMDVCSSKSARKTLVGGGTFSANPISMTAGAVTLEILRKNEKKLYRHIDGLGEVARRGLEEVFFDEGIRARCTGIGSFFSCHFPLDERPLTNSQDIEYHTDMRFREDTFKLMMAVRGFYLMHGGGAFSSAHTRAHADKLLEAASDVATALARKAP